MSETYLAPKSAQTTALESRPDSYRSFDPSAAAPNKPVRSRLSIAARIALGSLLISSALSLSRSNGNPLADFSGGVYTDHASHINAARGLPLVGADLWRKPLRSLYPAPSIDQRASVNPDLRIVAGPTGTVHDVPQWPAKKPWTSNWSDLPRPYPPGALLLFMPAALAYHLTDLNVGGANQLAILLLLVYAHLGIYALWKLTPRILGAELPASKLLSIALAITHLEVLHWTLEGFYDGAMLAPLLLSLHLLRERRYLWALCAYSVAAFLHYRAFALAPLPIAACAALVREGVWRRMSRADWGITGLTVVLSSASLVTFAWVAPWLDHFPDTNVLHGEVDPRWPSSVPVPLAVALVCAASALFLWNATRRRAWLELATGASAVLYFASVRQTQAWHALALIPILCLPAARLDRAAFALRCAFVGVFSIAVCQTPIVPVWLAKLL